MRYHHTFIRMPKTQNSNIAKFWEDMEQQELSFMDGNNRKVYS